MKAIKNAVPIHISEVESIELSINDLLENHLGLKPKEYSYIGSFGQREFSSDIDILISESALDLKDAISGLKAHGYKDIVPSQGFNQLSFGFSVPRMFKIDIGNIPYEEVDVYLDSELERMKKEDLIKIYQVDLMFSKNFEWSKFIYYSDPSSKFKGVYRNLLLMSTMIVQTKVEIDNDNYEQWNIRLKDGLYNVKKTFEGKSGKRLKNPRVIEESFITDHPEDISKILDIPIEEMGSFENLLKHIERRSDYNQIMVKFEDYCNSLKIEIPDGSIY